MSDADKETGEKSDEARPILVGIGASPEGISTLEAFFDQLPAETGAAYVVIIHLDPQHRSELPKILAAQTLMPVIEVQTSEELRANHVYVSPPDRRLQIVENQLSAARFDEPPGQRAAIDLFFRSGAGRLGNGAVVIVSGTGSDGAIGVKAVKEAGGVVLVQDPAEAESSSMPRSAIATGVADFVLPVRELVARLIDLIALKKTSVITPGPARDEASPRRAVGSNAALAEAALRHRTAIERSGPPSMLVNESYRVVHLSKSAGCFIVRSADPLSGSVVDLVRPELRLELRSALKHAFERAESSLSRPIPVRFSGRPNRVQLMVRLVPPDKRGEAPQAIVMFIEGQVIDEAHDASERQQGTNDTGRRFTEEAELSESRTVTMQEESEAANELPAANEELQSVNEEYLSTPEQLASEEALQSINEERQTVNNELKLKLDAISCAHDELQNLMSATDIGILFLDPALNIKWFTDRVTELFSITRNDAKRPITEFAHQLEYGDLIKDARTVLADSVPLRREVRSRTGSWYDMRIRPYRTVDNKVDGVVITFVDMTERLQTENALRESESQLLRQKQLVSWSHEAIFVWNFDGTIVDWNRGCEELYGYSRSEAIGKRKEELFHGDAENLGPLKAALLEDGSWNGERKHRTKAGLEVMVEALLQLESFDGERLVLESARDMTERRLWERRQELLLRELNHRVRNTLAVVQAIAYQTQRRSSSLNEFSDRFGGRLAALARCHDLLTKSQWQGADLETLARENVAPYLSDTPDRFAVAGERVALPADLATPFGLIFHELTTNAAKYGSLSVARGRVALRWSVSHASADNLLQVVWREINGPPVRSPARSGLGSSLLESVIANGAVKREFREEGLICTIAVPLAER